MDEHLKKIYQQVDIENFITNNTEESIHLDFKRAEALNNSDEIAKDVSAFANSDGGIIVYGIDEDKTHKASKPSYVNGNQKGKEWLEQIINSNIQRKIEGLIIDPIRIDNDIEKTMYVVKIPSSLNAPHQTKSKKFYRRYNFESVPMEEYEVRNAYNRPEKTILKLISPYIKGQPTEWGSGIMKKYGVHIDFKVHNIGQAVERDYKTEIRIPKIAAQDIRYNLHDQINKYFVRDDEVYSLFSIPNSSPIFQEEETSIYKLDFKLNAQAFQSIVENEITLKLYYSNGIDNLSLNLSQELKIIPGIQQYDLDEYYRVIPPQMSKLRKLELFDFRINSSI